LLSLSQQLALRNKSENKCAIEYRGPYYLKVPPWKSPTKRKLKLPLDRGRLTNMLLQLRKLKTHKSQLKLKTGIAQAVLELDSWVSILGEVFCFAQDSVSNPFSNSLFFYYVCGLFPQVKVSEP
jgi:hypothetical protein